MKTIIWSSSIKGILISSKVMLRETAHWMMLFVIISNTNTISPAKPFIGLIHRLDRPVSGAVIYARTTKALSRMTNQFRYREVQKTYWAVVKNPPPKDQDTIINYMIKVQSKNKSFVKHHAAKDHKESELTYKVIGHGNHYTFVEIYPKTGRHHQIRATLADLGSPIKGDIKYGLQQDQ